MNMKKGLDFSHFSGIFMSYYFIKNRRILLFNMLTPIPRSMFDFCETDEGCVNQLIFIFL